VKRIVTKHPIVNIVLGVLLLALSITALFHQPLLDEGILYMAAGLVALFAVVRFHKEFKLHKAQKARYILTVEFVLVILLAALLIFADFFTIAIVLGLVIYLQGATRLLIAQALKKLVKFERFLMQLLYVTLGAFLVFSAFEFEDALRYIVIGLLALYGLIFLIFGIRSVVNERKKKKAQAPKETPIETKPHEAKPSEKASEEKTQQANDKREAMMKKTVDELKAMCKSRGITGYSGLTKAQLVERIWRHDKEHK